MNTQITAEAITCLDMLETINSIIPENTSGELIIITDCEHMYNQIHKTWLKSGTYVRDASSTINKIKQIINTSSFDIELQLIVKYKKKFFDFNTEPEKYIMKECNKEAKRVWDEIDDKIETRNIKYHGDKVMFINNQLAEKPIRNAIRIADAMEMERQYINGKCPDSIQYIDMEARNVFNKGCTTSMLKCVYGYNAYGMRDVKINKDLTDGICPRCQSLETWDHVIRCTQIQEMKYTFIKTLHVELKKQDKKQKDTDKRKKIISDIFKYINNRQGFETHQEAIGFDNLFRGIIVNSWIGENLLQRIDHKYNRILVKQCVEFYNQCWLERCKVAHDEEVQRPRLIEWYNQICTRIQNSELYHLKRYIDVRKLNLDQVKTETIMEWIKGLLQMEKRTETYNHQDIRNWFT